MPERDGLETLLTVRRISPLTRVAIMSGRGSQFDYLEAGLKLGADAAVSKPIERAHLISVLKRLKPVTTISNDQRRTTRLSTHIEGQMFEPASWKSTPCCVLNLSEGGALVECAEDGQVDQEVVLHVAHFGRFEATVAHCSASFMGLSFKAGEAERNRLKEMLKVYAERGMAPFAPIRRRPRITAGGKTSMRFASDRENLCDVLDISPDSISLKTAERPSIGEILYVGGIRGRVIRHHAEGISLLFE
jgi:CheY-like chemotaxis protein